MFKVLDFTENDLIAIRVIGKVTKEDYDKINPLVDKTVKQYGTIKLFVQLDEMTAMKADALAKDIKMYLNNYKNIRKAAVTGDSSWQKLIAEWASPLIAGKIKYFPEDKAVEAQQWIRH